MLSKKGEGLRDGKEESYERLRPQARFEAQPPLKAAALGAKITQEGFLKVNCRKAAREGGLGHSFSITSFCTSSKVQKTCTACRKVFRHADAGGTKLVPPAGRFIGLFCKWEGTSSAQLGTGGKTGEAPPGAEKARLFRGSGTIGGHRRCPGIVLPRRWGLCRRDRRTQQSLAPAGMESSTISRCSFSSPFSVWTAEISMPQLSCPIIFRGGRFTMATRVLPTKSSGS